MYMETNNSTEKDHANKAFVPSFNIKKAQTTFTLR
jgi:hypothetical protein